MLAGMKLAVLALVLVGCSSSSSSSSSPPPMRASDYDQSCTAPSDCSVVTEGDVCDCPGCGNAAVRSSELMRYQSDYAARTQQCPSGTRIPCPALACIESLATCVAGKCGVCHAVGCNASDAGSDASKDATGD
jgi:hypothetical protein